MDPEDSTTGDPHAHAVGRAHARPAGGGGGIRLWQRGPVSAWGNSVMHSL